MEIPSHTAVAYGLIELEIKYDGCFGEEFFQLYYGLVISDQKRQENVKIMLSCAHL